MTLADPVESIPDPDTVRTMLAQSIRRSELLRSLLRVARRKAAFDRPAISPAIVVAEVAAAQGGRQ